MAAVPEIPPELLPYEGILDVRFLTDDRLPLQRRVWLSEQYRRNEITVEQLLAYVKQYLEAPETVAPAAEIADGGTALPPHHPAREDAPLTETDRDEAGYDGPMVGHDVPMVEPEMPPGFVWNDMLGRPEWVGDEGVTLTGGPNAEDGASDAGDRPAPAAGDQGKSLGDRVPALGREAGAGQEDAGPDDVAAPGGDGAPGDGPVPGDDEGVERPPPSDEPQGSEAEIEQPSILKLLDGSSKIPDKKKEELRARFAAGTLNETMLRILIASYDEDDQTEESDSTAVEEPVDEQGASPEAAPTPLPVTQPLPVEEAVTPEDMPVLTTAAALAPPDEEEIPPPPEQSLPPPPGEMHGIFSVEKGRYGPGTWGVDIVHPDGTYEPVMRFLQRTQPDWDGPTVGTWLEQGGLPQELSVRLGRQRQGNLDGVAVAVHHPAVAQLSEEEMRHYADKDAFSRAFIESQSKKKKGDTK